MPAPYFKENEELLALVTEKVWSAICAPPQSSEIGRVAWSVSLTKMERVKRVGLAERKRDEIHLLLPSSSFMPRYSDKNMVYICLNMGQKMGQIVSPLVHGQIRIMSHYLAFFERDGKIKITFDKVVATKKKS